MKSGLMVLSALLSVGGTLSFAQSPQIVSTSPSQNELNVPVSADISVTFDVDMDETTINDSTLVVHARSTGPHQGSISYSGPTRTATFALLGDFAVGEVVTVMLTQEIRSSGGTPLGSAYAWSFTTAVGPSLGTFVMDSSYSIGGHPRSVFCGDFDRDGDLDVVASKYNPKGLSVLMNAGDGAFVADSEYNVPGAPASVFAADLNDDGYLDLAIAHSEGVDRLSVLMNNGDGTFTTDSIYFVRWPPSVFASDLDGDVHADLVAANFQNNQVSVFLNHGDGTFAAPSGYRVGSFPRQVFAADLDGDGDVDLTTANSSSRNVSVLFNNGDGTFTPDSRYPGGASSVFAADFDGDGDLDLAASDPQDETASVLRNDGFGVFTLDSAYPVGSGRSFLFAGDLDGDGDLDVACTNYRSSDISILLNNGDGVFDSQPVLAVSGGPRSVFAADLDGDGALDLATANADSGSVSVLLNNREISPADVGTDSILSPPDSVRAYFNYTPSVVVKNFGVDSAGPIRVICSINPWRSTKDIPVIGGFESMVVDFDAWTVPDTGTYSVIIFTQYPADTNSTNDTIRKNVHASTYPRGPDMLWQKTYGGGAHDEGYSVQQASDGGYIIAGETHSFGQGEGDSYLVKTYATGSPAWTKTYGNWYDDEGRSVQQTSDGGYIVAGRYSMDQGWGHMYTYLWLVKTDASGNRSWARHVGTGHCHEEGRSVRQTYDGDYIAVGSRYREGPPFWNNEVYLAKISASGEILWTRSHGEADWIDEWGYAVEETADSGYIIAGNKESSGDSDVYVIKTDRDGEVLWERTYGGDSADVGRSVKQMTDGGYIIAGLTKSFGGGDKDVYVIRVDESGDLIWERVYGGQKDDVGRSICESSDGGYVVAGSTRSFGAGKWDVWLIKIDADGNVMWAQTYGGRGSEVGHSVQETSDGGYIVAGGCGDFYLVKTKGWVGVQEERSPERHFLICMGRPNPFTDRTSVQYELPERREVCITIYNLLGQEVKTLLDEHQPAGLHTVIWNATDNSGRKVPSGAYFLRLEAGEYTATRKLCVVR